MVKNYLVFGFALILVVFLSGCLGMSPEALAFANPLVKQFMSEYPNAQIQITHFTAEQVAQMLENISSECGNPYMEAKDMYRITIDDPDSGLKVISWIDWENREIECAVKYGTGEDKTISKPGEPIKTCKSHAEFRCYGQHVYWFDSCGHVQEKKEYCQEGCELGFCREKETKTCEEMGGYCVYPEVVPAGSLTGMITGQPLLATQDVFCGWSTYHECESNGDCAAGGCSGQVCGGVNEDLTTTCEYKDCYNADKFGAFCECYEGKCRWSEAKVAKPMCVDSDEGKNYHEKGYVFTGESKMWDHCNDDGTLTEKYCTEDGQIGVVKVSCPEGGKCEDGICIGGEGETSEEEEVITELVCEEGYAKAEYWCPENGICCAPKEVECEAHHRYRCYEGHVFWFDSCGKRQEKKHYCEHGCEDNQCIEKIVAECWDSDGGKHYDKEGVVETSDNQRFEDHCNEDGTLTEIYCLEGEAKSIRVECPAETICLEGVCRGNETCTVVSDCYPEGFTPGSCGPFYECSEGKCYEGSATCPPTTECTDSDGGKNYYTKGAITWIPYTTGVQKTDEDVCSNSSEAPLLNVREEGAYLYETYCEDIPYPGAFVVYECPNGCENGACVVGCEGIEMVWFVEGEEVRRDPDCDSNRSSCYNCEGFCYSFASDGCDSYRCLTGNEINPACYTFQECIEACDNECVNIPLAKEQCETI
jgi:eight-cysteine-cluster-containing protein